MVLPYARQPPQACPNPQARQTGRFHTYMMKKFHIPASIEGSLSSTPPQGSKNSTSSVLSAVSADRREGTPLDILCFSHLRWHFVTQRPQHLLTRAARERRVFFWEEPYFDGEGAGSLQVIQEALPEGGQLWVVRPHLPAGGDANQLQSKLLSDFVQQFAIEQYICWYYTPMALGFTDGLHAEVTVYDCMDELSGFLGAPPELHAREGQLFEWADVVFTGGMSLYEAKRKQHRNVHAFPSSIEVEHFRSATGPLADPADQAEIPHPRAGFYGVLDERFDSALMAEVARLRPKMQFIFIGPIVKIDPATLPSGGNIHYLGPKKYTELPAYLAGWDVAMLPFARNESTRFISPTKTPEYLAAGKPVVSTPIHDVVSGYGDQGLVAIAGNAEGFAAALDAALEPPAPEWEEAVRVKLATNSWDTTWAAMWREIEAARVMAAINIGE
jgi:UDP-galactopyranose mutase